MSLFRQFFVSEWLILNSRSIIFIDMKRLRDLQWIDNLCLLCRCSSGNSSLLSRHVVWRNEFYSWWRSTIHWYFYILRFEEFVNYCFWISLLGSLDSSLVNNLKSIFGWRHLFKGFIQLSNDQLWWTWLWNLWSWLSCRVRSDLIMRFSHLTELSGMKTWRHIQYYGGQSSFYGLPRISVILNIMLISESPWKIGFPIKSSAITHPTDQISTGVEYSWAPKSISGARYHIVTTSCV